MPSSPIADSLGNGTDQTRTPLRLALVVPRFGESVAGGAELHGRWLAERLAARGHSVDIFTTCALDWRTWRNELEPGVEQWGALTVNRFPINDRDLGIHGELDVREARSGRVPVEPTWGRPESVRQEFRRRFAQ